MVWYSPTHLLSCATGRRPRQLPLAVLAPAVVREHLFDEQREESQVLRAGPCCSCGAAGWGCWLGVLAGLFRWWVADWGSVLRWSTAQRSVVVGVCGTAACGLQADAIRGEGRWGGRETHMPNWCRNGQSCHKINKQTPPRSNPLLPALHSVIAPINRC
jgi:hypothetical protein